MRKYLTFVIIFYVIGIVLSGFVNAETMFLIALASFLSSFLFKVNKKIVVSVLSFAMGFIVAVSTAYVSTYPYKDYFHKTSDIICQIVSYETDKETYVQYDAKIIIDGKAKGAKINLFVDNRYTKEIYDYGDVFKIKNAKLVSYTDYKDFRSIVSDGRFARIWTEDFNMEKVSTQKANFIKDKIYFARDEIIKINDTYLPSEVSSIVKSITVADKTSLTEKVKDNFNKSGLSHLLAISGFHLSILVSYAVYVFSRLSKNKKNILSLFVSIFICTVMIIITGGQLSVIRASVMLLLYNIASAVCREYDSKTALLTAGTIIVLLNPFSIYDVGFLLSFFATLGIIVFSPKISSYLVPKIKNKYFADLISITLSAQIGVTPILIIGLNTLQILSIFANIIAVPVFSLLFMFSLLFLLVAVVFSPLVPIMSGLVFLFASFLLKIAEWFAKIPFSSFDVIGVYFAMDMLFIAAAILAGAVFFKTKKLIEKIVSLILVVVLILAVFFIKNGDMNFGNILPNSNISTNLKVSFLDVGQGDCALVQVDEKTVLIDGGSSSEDDIGKYKIKPYLLSNGVSKLDYAIVSHYHDDHYSGILYLLDNFDIGTLVLTGASNSEDYKEKELLVDAATRNDVPIYYFYSEDGIKLSDEIVLNAYSPLRNITYSSNDESLVLKLESPYVSFLFTGDIEKSGENKLRSSNLGADVLKVAHHGSNSSSTDAFLDNVSPSYAVISCGKNNMYSHPHDEVIERLEKRKIKYFRTDEIGDIVFNVSEDGKISIN